MIAIRPATEADLPVVLALLRHLSPDEPPAPLAHMRAAWQRVAAVPDMRVWLAEEDGVAVGTYTFLVMPNLCHNGTPASIVESVVVDPAARGRRIGEAMMRHAVAQAAAAGCYKLALSSNGRRLDAHRFYRRLGFREHGISFAIGVR